MSALESFTRDETDAEISWIVKETDEARYNFSDEKRVWQPRPEDILSMFEKLAQGNPLQLNWTCPGRRAPDRNANSEKNTLDGDDVEGGDSKEEELKAPETSAFDFDEPPLAVNSTLVPKRTPGGLGRTPKTEKRVARMDNIMESLKKQQLQRAAERAARKTKGSPSTTPGRSRLLNFGTGHFKHSAASSSMASSSPRFAGSSSSPNTSPLPNRGSMFMTPAASARKMTPAASSARRLTPNPSTNGTAVQKTAADSRTTEADSLYSSTFTNSHQGGSSFDFSESRSEQINSAREFAESSADGQAPSSTASPQNDYTSSSAFSNSTTTNPTKASTPGPFMPSIVSTSLSMASSSMATSTDKESIITTTDSNQQFVSRTVVSTAASSISTNSAVTPETHSASSAGVPPGGSHISSGVNLENLVPEAPSHDHPPSHTESVSLSTLNINSDVQHFGNANWKPQSS